MNFDRNLNEHHGNPSFKKLLYKILAGAFLIFLLLFLMNFIVKNQVSSLIQAKGISEIEKSAPQNANQ